MTTTTPASPVSADKQVGLRSIITGQLLERLIDECSDRDFGLLAEPFARAIEREVTQHLASKSQAEPVAEVDEGDDGLFIDFIYGPNGSPLKRGDKLYAAPQGREAQAERVPAEIAQIGKLIATQDNRYTDQPMFIVQQRRRITGFDTDYCDNIVWLCSEDDFSEASEEEAAQLEAEYQETGRAKNGWMRTGYVDQWEFVTACFTEQGCKDYLARDGHNLKEPRIYAEGSYRNEEFRALRNWLMSLASPVAQSATASQEGDTGSVRELLAALGEFVNNSQEHDVGGGDVVVTTCEARERAVALLKKYRDPSLGACGTKPEECPDRTRCGCDKSLPAVEDKAVGQDGEPA